MEKLLNCPFCGGEARYNRKQMPQGCVLVGYDCEQCGAAAPVFTGPEAIEKSMKIQAAEAWNRRTQQPNEPLTVGELRKMDGQPVWVKAVDPNDSDTNYWAIVSANMHYSHKSGGVISTSTDGVAVVAIAYFEDYGKSWLAYRRPPEAGEKG